MKPSFVIMMADDLGYGDLACFGSPIIKSPNIDRLAAEGIKLTDCYAGAPVCSPSRAAMLTGRTPTRCGIDDWIREGSDICLAAEEIAFPKLLKSAGYATAHVGKWHLSGKFNSPEQSQPGDHGYDHWFATQNNAQPNHRNPDNFIRNGQPVGPMEGYSSTLIVQEGMNWLDTVEADEPFCLVVWFHTPHVPIATAAEFVAMYPDYSRPAAEFYGNVTQMDHEIGRLMKKLDDLGRRENTLVFFTSDNGPRNNAASAAPLRGQKSETYEGGIREPGILRWPAKIAAGQVSAEPVHHADLLPTMCAIAGVAAPADRKLDGASLLPLLENKPLNRQVPLYWNHREKLALREGDWKLLCDALGFSEFELYNLRQDIAETTNLAAAEPARLKAMSEMMKEMYNQIRGERGKAEE